MVVCCLAWGGGSPPACPPRAKGCLFHINLLSYRWLHLPRYQQRAPRQQQRPVRAPRHTFRDSSPYSSTYFFLALQLLHLLGLVLNIQACLPKHRQEPPGHQTSCLPVSGGDFQLHYLQGFLDILTWRPGIANYAATACHRMPQDATARWKTTHRPRGHCPECEEFSARPVCQRRADCGGKILAVRRPIAEGAKDETARFHRGDDTGSLT